VDRPLRSLTPSVQLLPRRRRGLGVLLQAPFVFRLNALRVGQQRPDILPDCGFQWHLPYGGKRTEALAIATPAVAANAAVIAVMYLTIGTAGRLGVAGIATLLTNDESLKQMAAALPSPAAFLVVTQLLGDCGEEFLSDQGGDRDPDPLVLRAWLT